MFKARELVLAVLAGAWACSVFPSELSDSGDAAAGGQGADAGVSEAAFPDSPGSDACDTQNDPDNCGSCGSKCPSANVLLRRCADGKCKPRCQPGFLDCTKPTDTDGCETPVGVQNCGGCGLACGPSQTCNVGEMPMGQCSCTSAASCGLAGVACTGSPPACQCPSDAGTLDCQPGEHCNDGHCECIVGQPPCTGLQICCPGIGCVDFLKDHENCGGCGVRCEQTIPCNGGKCKCSNDSTCNNGATSFSCNPDKLCVCNNNVPCAPGQACRLDACD